MVDCAFTKSETRWTVRLLRVNRGGLFVYLEFYLGRSVVDCTFTLSKAWRTVRLLSVKRGGLCVNFE